MAKRGRKSTNDLSVLSYHQPPPAPPSDLTAEQQEEWRAVAGHMPDGWFGAESMPLLAEYVRHITRARFLARGLDHFQFDALGEEGGIETYDRLSKAAERETRAMLAAARALRLTPQARIDAAKAGRAAANHSTLPKPWE